jgi:hypothetical protein
MSLPIQLTSYTPAIADIPESRILDVRARLETYIKAGWPDLDTRPNSVYGDLVLTPMSTQIAAQEIAAEHFVSDFDLQQIADGVIYNCDVVKAYLQNFAAVERDNLKASGVVRLTFSANSALSVDRGTAFLFGTENVFALRLAGPGSLNILTVGSTRSNVNDVVLSQLDATTYAVDVPVIGVMPTPVSAGDTASINNTLAGLLEATAIGTFNDGAPESSLPVLAARTRETFYSSSLNTRGGAQAFVRKEFPGVSGVAAAISGDTEMLRDTTNALGFRDGRLDVNLRSSQGLLSATQVVKLTYDSAVKKFFGILGLAQIPVAIDSIVAEAASTVTLTRTILSRSTDATRAPLAAAAYSELEQLWLIVTMPEDGNSLPLIPVETDGIGNYWAYFTIAYRFDPSLLSVATVLNSAEVRPVGVDVLTKAQLPIVITAFNVQYIKPAGQQVNQAQARTEILAYFQKLSYPDVYVDAAISDSLLYAGASGVKSITCTANAQWSVANAFLPTSATLPAIGGGIAAALAAAITPPVLTISVTTALTPTYQDPNLGQPSATYVAAGKRNVGYVLDTANLTFSEYLP